MAPGWATAADDKVFPLQVARLLGIDLSNAPMGSAAQAGGTVLTYRYAPVHLRLSDGVEAFEWDAIVGFLDRPGMRRALLGHSGFLDFFDVLLRGEAKEAIVTPNGAFPGQKVRP